METKEKEIFVDIQGYEGLYMISNWGRVKALNYHRMGKEQILKPRKDKDGYLGVCLCKNNKKKTCQIHRLVALAFIPNPNGYKEVNHLSEDKTLNTVESLEWTDHKSNITYGTGIERRAKARSKKVYQYDLEGNFIKEFASANEVERQTGYGQGNISKCCLGRYKQAYGFLWTYAPINFNIS